MDGASYSTYELRTRAVEAVLAGMPIVAVAEAYRTDRTTIHRWLVRYRQEGEQGLLRRPVDGRPRKLHDLTEKRLCAIVLKPASTYGYETDLWSVRRLHQVIQEHYDASVSRYTVWRRLREAGLTYQKPEREYFQMDPKERKKWMEVTLPQIRETVEKYRAILYCEDEANVSLTAFLGKTWAPCGQTPRAKVTGKRGGLAAMSAISPRGHLFFMLYEKRITSVEVIAFLKQLLAQHKRRHVVVVMDRAPPHTSNMTEGYMPPQQNLWVDSGSGRFPSR
jgi:transposase